MLEGRSVLAVVPARSGSKGIRHKNMRPLCGVSLIGWAGRTLGRLPWLDRRVLSTDSPQYASEGERHGLSVPFLRPAPLATDDAATVDTVRHALEFVETADGRRFDVVLVVEPTSPLRLPSDIESCTRRLLATGADAVVSVSPVPAKSHPRKVLRVVDGNLTFYEDAGRALTRRQDLPPLFYRDGVCYALTRACLVEQGAIIGRWTVGLVTEHPVVNIDEAWELEWAEVLLERGRVRLS